jgi:uroporphyrin-III C-methyltransferase
MSGFVSFVSAGPGADVKGEPPDNLNWAALADPWAMTALYMGKRTFPALAARPLTQGMSPDTPAPVAESIGHADQRLVRTTIAKLAEQLSRENVTATAVILYGALAGTH